MTNEATASNPPRGALAVKLSKWALWLTPVFALIGLPITGYGIFMLILAGLPLTMACAIVVEAARRLGEPARGVVASAVLFCTATWFVFLPLATALVCLALLSLALPARRWRSYPVALACVASLVFSAFDPLQGSTPLVHPSGIVLVVHVLLVGAAALALPSAPKAGPVGAARTSSERVETSSAV
jgi:hypothetical protein